MFKITLILSGMFVCSVGAFAQSDNPMKTIAEKIAASDAKEKEYTQIRKAEAKELQDQIKPLQEQLKAAPDKQTRQKINTKLKLLLEERDELFEEMAEHSVETLQKQLDQAKERLKVLREKIQNHKA